MKMDHPIPPDLELNKARTFQLMNFAVSVDHRINIKGKWKIPEILRTFLRTKVM